MSSPTGHGAVSWDGGWARPRGRAVVWCGERAGGGVVGWRKGRVRSGSGVKSTRTGSRVEGERE